MQPSIRVIIQFEDETLHVPELRYCWDYEALIARIPASVLQRLAQTFSDALKAMITVLRDRDGITWSSE